MLLESSFALAVFLSPVLAHPMMDLTKPSPFASVPKLSARAEQGAGYALSGWQEMTSGGSGSLILNGQPANQYGTDIEDLDLLVEYQTPQRLHVHISDKAKTQFQIPPATSPRPQSLNTQGNSSTTSDLEFHYTATPFSFWVTRRESSQTIFDTRSHSIVFSDRYLQLTTSLLANGNMYGPGEIVSSKGLLRSSTDDRTVMWNRDAPTPRDENIYGSHPFYLSTGPDGAFGVFLLNSHGMEMVTKDHQLTYNVLGGTFDFYFMSGPTPMEVIKQYSEIVGRPARMPYWAFGLHMCRWGGDWKTPDQVKQVAQRMKEADIPLETVWTDLDYMDKFRNFETNSEWNKEKYADLVDTLHRNKQHYIPIVDAAIGKPKQGEAYQSYDRGTELDIWIKGEDDKAFVGQVWPGDSVWPDWTAESTQGWWQESFDHYRETVAYDGIWLDMNEPSSFAKGKDRSESDAKNLLNSPAFNIQGGEENFWDKTISPAAKLADGFNHYHEHNIYGLQQNQATQKVLLEQMPNLRPLIISRSTFAGSGKTSGHWLGDNFSFWESIQDSIQGILQFQMFQIPMVGADAGGFLFDCTEELANRWMQLAAFTPFFRNHNSEGSSSQEPYQWPSVVKASKKAIHTRYQLLPYWETLFAKASMDGTPPLRPLFFEFDQPGLEGVDEQFLVGSSLLIAPVLRKGETQVQGFFPTAGGVWRDWYTYKPVAVNSDNQAILPTPLGSINVHIRPGSIILIHDSPAYSLLDTRTSPYGLIISLDENGAASGTAILDDGLSIDGPETTVTFTVTGGDQKIVIKSQGEYTRAPRLTQVTILGAGEEDEVKEINVDQLDLSAGGEVAW